MQRERKLARPGLSRRSQRAALTLAQQHSARPWTAKSAVFTLSVPRLSITPEMRESEMRRLRSRPAVSKAFQERLLTGVRRQAGNEGAWRRVTPQAISRS
jgi:hypothetical protein